MIREPQRCQPQVEPHGVAYTSPNGLDGKKLGDASNRYALECWTAVVYRGAFRCLEGRELNNAHIPVHRSGYRSLWSG